MNFPTRPLFAALLSLAMLAVPADEPVPGTVSEPRSSSESRDTATPDRGRTNTNSNANTKADDAARFSQDVILQALSFMGVNYKWGGASADKGLDCSGLILQVFQQAMSISLPHNAFAISRLGDQIEKDELKPGDLVFFNTLGRKFSHVGIYMGDDRFIHAPRTGASVQVVKFSDAYWSKRYNGARRLTKESVAERSPMLEMLMREGNRERGNDKASKKKGKSSSTSKGKSSKSASAPKHAKKKH